MPIKYKRQDYLEKYGSVMQFDKNKNEYIHRWYPFVEGYSKEFIWSIINELDYIPTSCLDPFSGSGTTPLELQKLGIKCTSFEVCPFMYDLSVSKMRTDYTIDGFKKNINILNECLNNIPENINTLFTIPKSRYIVEKEDIKRWNFNKDVFDGIVDLKFAISCITDIKYRKLFTIALASILLKVSNVYRNGKCVSYKKNWKDKISLSREDIHNIYFNRINEVFFPDIEKIENYKLSKKLVSNYKNCKFGDVRKEILNLDDNSTDLIITSPPYLNSRDYTDSYMVELRMLDYFNKFDSMNQYRSRTIRSHVQVKWPEIKPLNISLLNNSVADISKQKELFWNDSLINMINGYFQDMDSIFDNFSRVLTNNGHIFFNIANSAYYGIEIKVDEIIAEIAESKGLKVKEIRNARFINPSSQQKKSISHLIESVLVITK